MTENIVKTLRQLLREDKKICITSSFQTHSLPLLHICKEVIQDIPVLFIDTGFHFAETYAFRDEIVEKWELNLFNIRSNTSKIQQMDSEGRFLYTDKPETCCYINKVEPLDKEIKEFDVWVAGLRRDQTSHRRNLETFEELKNGVTKYHPILDWNSKMIFEYRKKHDLPYHPLEDQGYFSIGCLPCTTKVTDQQERDGRWLGSSKTECGIHLK